MEELVGQESLAAVASDISGHAEAHMVCYDLQHSGNVVVVVATVHYYSI